MPNIIHECGLFARWELDESGRCLFVAVARSRAMSGLLLSECRKIGERGEPHGCVIRVVSPNGVSSALIASLCDEVPPAIVKTVCEHLDIEEPGL